MKNISINQRIRLFATIIPFLFGCTSSTEADNMDKNTDNTFTGADTPLDVLKTGRKAIKDNDKRLFLDVFADHPDSYLANTLAYYEVEQQMWLFHHEYMQLVDDPWKNWEELYVLIDESVHRGFYFSVFPNKDWMDEITTGYTTDGELAELRDKERNLSFVCRMMENGKWKYAILDRSKNELQNNGSSIVSLRLKENLIQVRKALKNGERDNKKLSTIINSFSKNVTIEELENYKEKIKPKYMKP